MLSINYLVFFHQQRSREREKEKGMSSILFFSHFVSVFFSYTRCKTNIDHMSFNATISKERELLREYIFVYMYSCLNEIIAFRSVFKDNSLVSLNRTNRTPKPI